MEYINVTIFSSVYKKFCINVASKDKYAVDVIDKYAGQESLEEFFTHLDWTYRSNVFAKTLKAETFTPEALVETVQNIYAATEQFKNGVEQLRAAARHKVEEKQTQVSSAFGG